MGRVKGALVKKVAEELLKRQPGVFSTDFASNKAVLKRMALLKGKERNELAGELVALIRKIRPAAAPQPAG